MARLLLPLLILFSPPLLAQAIAFANGGATVAPPAGYTHSLEDNGHTVVLYPPRKDLFEMRFTFHAVPERKGHPQLAREFVLEVARTKGKQPTRFKGGEVGFIERGPATFRDLVEYRNLEGLMTLGKGYVVLTLSVPEKNVQLPEIREFMKTGMEGLIASLRAK